MNINRHNYENFFLLYVDNELSAADKKTVDVFVQENPDLAAELLLLQQTIVDPDTIVFDQKDLLLKDEFVLIQEKLLLYVDNELTQDEVKQMESLVQHDVTAAAEWSILQQARLQPDLSVVFPNKKLLYKTEGGRIIVIRWWRIAAAAVLLGFGLWTGVASYKKYFSGPTGSVASANTNPVQLPDNNRKDNNTAVPVSPENNDSVTASNAANETIAESIQKNDPLQEPFKKANMPAEKTVTADRNNKQQQGNFTSLPRDNKKPSNNLPKSYLENINNKERNEITVNNVSPKNETVVNNPGINNTLVQPDASVKTNNTLITDNTPNGKDPKNTVAIPVVYNKTSDNNDRYLDTDEDNAKRTKVGGFFRKVKRLIERNTNIKTGNEVKVAGFEIAIK